MTLASRRYRIDPSQIIELAPFLFVWAAEESLRQRRERLAEVEKACEVAQNAEREIRHLPLPNFSYSEEKIAAELGSIDQRDLFGASIEDAAFLDPYFSFDENTENPFATFLRKLSATLGDVAVFEEWSGSWAPEYRVCPEEAAELVGGDRERADEILAGLAALNEMPKEIRQPDKTRERAEWVMREAEQYRLKLERDLAEFDEIFDSTGVATK